MGSFFYFFASKTPTLMREIPKEESKMDVLMLKLSTKFMKGIVAKRLSKKIYQKLGCKIDIQLNDVQIDTVEGDIKLHINADGKMSRAEFERLMERI